MLHVKMNGFKKKVKFDMSTTQRYLEGKTRRTKEEKKNNCSKFTNLKLRIGFLLQFVH